MHCVIGSTKNYLTINEFHSSNVQLSYGTKKSASYYYMCMCSQFNILCYQIKYTL